MHNEKSITKKPSTQLYVYGFPVEGANKPTSMMKVLAAHHIQETTGLKVINTRQIRFIKGKIWDETQQAFDIGPGANITVEGSLSQSDIDIINQTKEDKYKMYSLTYYLSYENDRKSHGKIINKQVIDNQTPIDINKNEKKFKNNVLKDLNNEIKANIEYNKCINSTLICDSTNTSFNIDNNNRETKENSISEDIFDALSKDENGNLLTADEILANTTADELDLLVSASIMDENCTTLYSAIKKSDETKSYNTSSEKILANIKDENENVLYTPHKDCRLLIENSPPNTQIMSNTYANYYAHMRGYSQTSKPTNTNKKTNILSHTTINILLLSSILLLILIRYASDEIICKGLQYNTHIPLDTG